ncbi:PaaI family thioesterase [Paraburkholderia antibiotica]|uniref:PaaI family thioesterase n=1 Tax=Paraburkholderia antibiotica TaxID=2728839 RepID=A0A7X9X7H4_9BURK|nr:PaaI family thioesterase [Paraburkholderia antibiotica]NML32876.1 PaaI family thioesterase [Paraburkholderia antibiotica]
MTDLNHPFTAPPDFELVQRGGAFFAHLAPVYKRVDGDTIVLGLTIGPQHANAHGNAHGGMLMTLADGALHDTVIRTLDPATTQIVTVNMSSDFLSAARTGDWLEAHTEVHRQGRTLSFAECLLKVGDRRVLRASATFAHVAKR